MEGRGRCGGRSGDWWWLHKNGGEKEVK